MKLGTTIPIYAPVGPIDLPKETATLVNISDSSFRGERTYGVYTICGVGKCKCSPEDPARCIPGDGYIMKVIGARRGMIDMGDNNWTARAGNKNPDLKNVQQFVVYAHEIANDLVREWRSDIFGADGQIETTTESVQGFAGVFMADGAIPRPDEIEEAKELLAACDRVLVSKAHAEWDQFHEPKTIHDAWKRAARRLGVDAPWLYTILNLNALPDCPNCGSKLKTATATVCAVCHRDVVPQNASPNGEVRPVSEATSSLKRKAKQGRTAAA